MSADFWLSVVTPWRLIEGQDCALEGRIETPPSDKARRERELIGRSALSDATRKDVVIAMFRTLSDTNADTRTGRCRGPRAISSPIVSFSGCASA